jgi:serine/threonine protein kinase
LGQSIVNVQPKPLPEYSPQLNCLILDMLEKTPAKRLSAAELLAKYFKEGIPLAVKQPEVPLTS